MSAQPAQWAKVDLTIFTDRRASRAALCVYVALRSFADRNGICWPAQTTLADLLQTSRKTIAQALADLEALGYLERLPQPPPRHGHFPVARYRTLDQPSPDKASAPAPTRAKAAKRKITRAPRHPIGDKEPCHPIGDTVPEQGGDTVHVTPGVTPSGNPIGDTKCPVEPSKEEQSNARVPARGSPTSLRSEGRTNPGGEAVTAAPLQAASPKPEPQPTNVVKLTRPQPARQDERTVYVQPEPETPEVLHRRLAERCIALGQTMGNPIALRSLRNLRGRFRGMVAVVVQQHLERTGDGAEGEEWRRLVERNRLGHLPDDELAEIITRATAWSEGMETSNGAVLREGHKP